MTAQIIPLGPPAKLELRHCALEYGGLVPSLPGRQNAFLPADVSQIGHRPILDAIASLLPGEAVRINVDHDPEPLLHIIEANDPARYAWEPLLEGPDRWVGLIKRTQPGLIPNPVLRLPPRLERRAATVGARRRLEREIAALATDLVGPADLDELSPESAAWLAAATDAAVAVVRDGALSVLVRALDRMLETAPTAVVHELDAIRNRHEAGLM